MIRLRTERDNSHSLLIGFSKQRENVIGLAKISHSLLIGFSGQRKNVIGLAKSSHKISNEYKQTE